MLLKALPPNILPDGLAAQLASLGISTSTDLIFSSTSLLEIYMRLPSKSISFTDFEACIDSISEKLAAPGLEAAKLDHETRLDFKMETLSSLDNYLGGGLPCKRIIEISGDKGSGKSVSLSILSPINYLFRSSDIKGSPSQLRLDIASQE